MSGDLEREPQVKEMRRNTRGQVFVFAFSATLFCSALLMFCIQPLVGKLLLPSLGGAPQVWNTCMVFFQAMLFAGYMYAYYTGVLLGLRRQAIFHLLLAVAAKRGIDAEASFVERNLFGAPLLLIQNSR